MKTFALGLFLFSTIASHASVFDLDTDATEMANAMAHCPNEVAKLLPPNEHFFVKNIESMITQGLKGVSTKGYSITTQQGGGFERVTKGQSLFISLTITQPPVAGTDMPSKQEWFCKLF